MKKLLFLLIPLFAFGQEIKLNEYYDNGQKIKEFTWQDNGQQKTLVEIIISTLALSSSIDSPLFVNNFKFSSSFKILISFL